MSTMINSEESPSFHDANQGSSPDTTAYSVAESYATNESSPLRQRRLFTRNGRRACDNDDDDNNKNEFLNRVHNQSQQLDL